MSALTGQARFDEDAVLVCMDETSKQQTKETRTPRPVRPRHPAVVDFEYERNGVANLFMVFAPLLGWRWVNVPTAEPGTTGRI